MFNIAVDAMGGDHAPEALVSGALAAAKQYEDITLILIGDERKIKSHMSEEHPRIQVHHTTEVIYADDEPARAVRRKKEASMVIAARMVKEGEADAMISAGNTGALLASGLFIIGRIPGVDRPGLAPMLPTFNGVGVLALDLGANMDATPEQLVQFGVMGSIYRHKVDGLAQPRVGLLNVGTEAKKGNELTREAFPLLEQAPVHFVGNVESRDILQNAYDVVVCDGFVGNILLKTMEGVGSSFISKLEEEFYRNWLTKIAGAIMKPGLKEFRAKLDYTEHGGAPLLGVNGVCIKGHGSSNANAIKNAIRQARLALENHLVEEISEEISRK